MAVSVEILDVDSDDQRLSLLSGLDHLGEQDELTPLEQLRLRQHDVPEAVVQRRTRHQVDFPAEQYAQLVGQVLDVPAEPAPDARS